MAHRFTLEQCADRRSSRHGCDATIHRCQSWLSVSDLHQPDKERNSRVSFETMEYIIRREGPLRLFNGTALQTAKVVLDSTCSSSYYPLICGQYGTKQLREAVDGEVRSWSCCRPGEDSRAGHGEMNYIRFYVALVFLYSIHFRS